MSYIPFFLTKQNRVIIKNSIFCNSIYYSIGFAKLTLKLKRQITKTLFKRNKNQYYHMNNCLVCKYIVTCNWTTFLSSII